MFGSVPAGPLLTRYDGGFIFNLFDHFWAVVSAVKADVCTAWKYLLKTRVFYLFSVILTLIVAPSFEDTYSSVRSCRAHVRHHTNGTVIQITDQNFCWFQRELFDRGFVHEMNSDIFSALTRPVTSSYNIATELPNEEIPSQLLPVVGFEEQLVSSLPGMMSLISNVLPVMIILFLRNLCSISRLVLKAPWFHFCVLLELVFRVFFGFSTSRNSASRFKLLLRLRMEIGVHQIKRLSNVGLLRLAKSQAPLHSLETIGGFPLSLSLSEKARMASLEDIKYLYCASDVFASYVEQLIVNRKQTAKKLRARRHMLSNATANIQNCDITYCLWFIILLLSLCETSKES